MALTATEKDCLLALARDAVDAAVRHRPLPKVPADPAPALRAVQGAFVTLHLGGRLRGCIGLIEGMFPLAETVIRMAAAAAMRDPRFRPVAVSELGRLDLEISVLSPLHRVASADEIVLGRDGVLVQCRDHCGVFLPQVAVETGWDKERFLSELCAGKAGLEPDAWRSPECELNVFTVEILQAAAQ